MTTNTDDKPHPSQPVGVASTDGLGPLLDSEEDPARLWAEIHLLRAELQGPMGFATWRDAAIFERHGRVQFQRDAMRFKWLAERTAATGLARWVHPFQFLADAVDERMTAGATRCD